VLVNELNAQINAIMTIVRARQTRRENEDVPPVAENEVSLKAVYTRKEPASKLVESGTVSSLALGFSTA
jgi:hypothetical protein